jgi:hypothetical protein
MTSSGYNHHQPHHHDAEARSREHRKSLSMHAKMHAIFSLTGISPTHPPPTSGSKWRAGAKQYPPSHACPRQHHPLRTPASGRTRHRLLSANPVGVRRDTPHSVTMEKLIVTGAGSGSGGGFVSKRSVWRPSSYRACCPAGGRASVEAEKAWSAAAGPTDQLGGHLRCAGDKGQQGERVIMLAMRGVASMGGA